MLNDTRCPISQNITVDLYETVSTRIQSRIVGLVVLVHTADDSLEPIDMIPGQVLTIGRDRDADLPILCDKNMSRQHFSIECRHHHAIVHDLGSTNGTFVNGLSIDQQNVQEGDQISAGMTTFTIRFTTA